MYVLPITRVAHQQLLSMHRDNDRITLEMRTLVLQGAGQDVKIPLPLEGNPVCPANCCLVTNQEPMLASTGEHLRFVSGNTAVAVARSQERAKPLLHS